MKTIETKKINVLLMPEDGPDNPETIDRLFLSDLIGGLGNVGAFLDITRNCKHDRANHLIAKLPGLYAYHNFIRALPK